MYTQEHDPMIIPFDPESYDNRASAVVAFLLVIFGLVVMFVGIWAFTPSIYTDRPKYSAPAPIQRGWELTPDR